MQQTLQSTVWVGVEGGEGVEEVDAEELGDGLVGHGAGHGVDPERHRRARRAAAAGPYTATSWR